jgi:dTDP-glucose pyrophosphorylase
LKTIILSAGKIDYKHLPFGMHQSNATIPVNGKPVISWILDDLISKGFNEVVVALNKENYKLIQMLEKNYCHRIKLDLAKIDNPSSILVSLNEALSLFRDNANGVQVILGDTLIQDSFKNLQNCIYSAKVAQSENWCIANSDSSGRITELFDKKVMPGSDHLALCGYYNFSNISLLKQLLEKRIPEGCRELSKVIMDYDKIQPLKLISAKNWYDFGHLESFIQSKKRLLMPRHFNYLTINPLLNTITKESEKSEKLMDELNWYRKLPEELKILTPRILVENFESNKVIITQEFYGYPALSELYVYGELSCSVWESIIDYLFQIHNIFKKFKSPSNKNHLLEMYSSKTYERIDQLLLQNPFWKTIWDLDEIRINGIHYKNIAYCLKTLEDEIIGLSDLPNFHILHGDFCLSNILYDLNNQIVRLIDPRGRFGEAGIYGDARYDVAKLRHSIVSQYDFIVGDLFMINYSEDQFEFQMVDDDRNQILTEYFDEGVKKNGYNIREIKLIEALLFVSMIPFHSDYFHRQQMMYIRATILLNNLL